MANNCLVTKLGSIIDNDNLVRMGALRVKISNYDPSAGLEHLYFISTTNLNYRVVGDGFISLSRNNDTGALINPTKEIIGDSGNKPLYFSSGTTFYIEVESKYSLTAIGGSANNPFHVHPQSVKLGDLTYIDGLTNIQLSMSGTSGDISGFKNMSDLINVLLEANPDVVGDISVFEDKPLIGLNLGGTGVHGDLSVLGTRQCNTLYINNTNVIGTLEDYCKEGCTARTSGSTDVYASTTSVTFNNLTFSRIKVTFTATGCTTDTGATYDKTNDTWDYGS